MDINENTIDKFALDLQRKGKQPATVESYCRDARRFLSFLQELNLPIKHVDPSTLIAFQESMIASGAGGDNSLRRSVIGVRQFFRFLSSEARLASSPLDDAPIPERMEALPSEWKRSRLAQVISSATDPGSGLLNARNAALIALLAYEGLKVSELINLNWHDWLPAAQPTLHISGDRHRTISLHEQTQLVLTQYREQYLRLKDPKLESVDPKKIFISFKGRDASLVIPHMTRHGTKFILYEVGNRLGIKHMNGELLRHHAIQFLLSEGRSPEDVMTHLGLRRMGLVKKYVNQFQDGPSSSIEASAEIDGI